MPRLPEKLVLLCALAAVAAGCKPEIGDDCRLSTDCSAAGDRLCDITAPGGYCTVYNCEPGTCPEDESLCVEFGAQRSPIEACVDKQSPSPYARAFCMATCEEDSDCRDGYVCIDLRKDNDWNALLIDRDRGGRACMVPFTATRVDDPETEHSVDFGEVCTSELPAETPDQPAETPDETGAGGAGGAATGASGQSGASAQGAASGQGGAG
jgi:hypothetical protein